MHATSSGFDIEALSTETERPSSAQPMELLAMNIAENASIDDGKTVVVFSLKMAKEALVQCG
jgi:replicative DNA helicase